MEALHYRVSDFRLPSEHYVAAVFILLRDLRLRPNLDILSPKRI